MHIAENDVVSKGLLPQVPDIVHLEDHINQLIVLLELDRVLPVVFVRLYLDVVNWHQQLLLIGVSDGYIIWEQRIDLLLGADNPINLRVKLAADVKLIEAVRQLLSVILQVEPHLLGIVVP